MTKLARRVLAGLEEAVRHAAGDDVPGLIVHVPETLDVAAIRKKTGQSQGAFATSIGVNTATLQQWEQGRRGPTGPARVLLAMVDRRPGIVGEVLGSTKASPARIARIGTAQAKA